MNTRYERIKVEAESAYRAFQYPQTNPCRPIEDDRFAQELSDFRLARYHYLVSLKGCLAGTMSRHSTAHRASRRLYLEARDALAKAIPPYHKVSDFTSSGRRDLLSVG